jgi:hypothetical protein
MATWTPFTLAGVTKGIPPEVLAANGAWVLANPEKAGRLGEIVDEVRAVFRAAVAVKNAVDAAAETVPFTGYHHAVAMVSYLLAIETGYTGPDAGGVTVPGSKEGVGTSVFVSTGAGGFNLMTELCQRMVRVDIWLRMVESGSIAIGNEGAGVPMYVPRVAGVVNG